MSFTFNFTKEKLAACVSRNKEPELLFQALNDVLPRYEINTVERVAAFLAQCGHESVDFTILRENLNYSTKGLMSTWPKRFPNEAAAAPYNRNPEKIANKVYADRMGNGPESSGEGYRYRGRGAIQLTGKSNYQAFATSVNRELSETVGYVETLPGAIESACWFWKKNNLNALADKQDMKQATKVINGGDLGLAERVEHFKQNLVKLSK